MSIEMAHTRKLAEYNEALSTCPDKHKRSLIEEERNNYLMDLAVLVTKYAAPPTGPRPKKRRRTIPTPPPTCRVVLEGVPGGPWPLPLAAGPSDLAVLLATASRNVGDRYRFQLARPPSPPIAILGPLGPLVRPGTTVTVAWALENAKLLGPEEPLFVDAQFLGPTGGSPLSPVLRIPLEADEALLNRILRCPTRSRFFVGSSRVGSLPLRRLWDPRKPLVIGHKPDIVAVRRVVVGATPKETKAGPCISSYVTCTPEAHAGSMYRDYLKMVDKRRIDFDPHEYTCQLCETPLIQLSGALVCPGFDVEEVDPDGVAQITHRDCGFQISVPAPGLQGVPYSTKLSITRRSCYQRTNHFREWLAQTQAKQRTEIPLPVLSAVANEFVKYRMRAGDITKDRVRAFLKDLDRAFANSQTAPKYSKYYEHAPLIAATLSGVSPPTMNEAQEKKLVAMFDKFQVTFEECPPSIKGGRKNCLSYGFVLYKLCELCRYDEFLPLFPLLKSSDRLEAHDEIWRWVCRRLGWEFIASI